MKNALTDEQLNQIRNSVDIVDVISSYIPLTTRGKNFFGVCPFHSDHSPSMSVSKEKQIYTCFSCGASGNIFNFIMDYENISFIEAVKICANKAGIPINIGKKEEYTDKYKDLYNIYDITQKFYVNNINTKDGIEAKEYLNNRQINNECIKEFGIGLSLRNDSLINLLINKKYDPKLIERTGLILKKDKGYTDMYNNRIMFPLYDLTGNIVGYSGRIYNTESNSKYFNTKETEIFKKGELLYNYHRAKDNVRKEGSLIVVEGFMDVIRMYTIGVTNVVAMMGTAVTKNQALLMKRLSNEIVLCFDGDSAGNEATNSCINELNKIGVTPKVVRLENDLDPDEYILKNGKEKFINKIKNPINAMEYKMNYLKKDRDLQNNFEMAKYVDSVLKELSAIENETYIELSLKKLSEEAKLNIDYLRSKMANKDKVVLKKIEQYKPKKDKYEIIEQNLIYQMMCNKDAIKMFAKYRPIINNEIHNKIINEIGLYYKENGNIILADIITFFKDAEIKNELNKIINSNALNDYKEEVVIEYLEQLKDREIKNQIKIKDAEIKKETDPIKKAEILNEIIKLKQMEENNGK